ncbi:DALR anticodon-binding domain-containing protein [Ancylothrix sp. C2]|uniref:DALR anticodon-binding domain-containing protein n=1 Tax=Ancylothrix sp. D3o TaxID=2953691 RepID=UPI0021BACE5F|nr:DALR anticodon-binding domain-containing protein [Ancylothrix sp. D3o]MCT7950716.1 DALR anticodon-binding domain-containing protein [Ancylothrix sp. D3o]
MGNFNVNCGEIPALKPQLLAQLQTVIPKNSLGCEPTSIPLTRAKNTTEIIYLSPIALKLARSQTENTLPSQLAADLSSLINAGCLDFTLEVLPSGWLQFHLAPVSLATWLQNLISTSLHSPVSPSPSASTSSLFSIQYTHARCCSLLQTAHREGLIILNQKNHQIITPAHLPWLNSCQCWRFTQNQELGLISRLVDTLDSLATGTCQNPLKLATGLSEAFDCFHSACRIWGDVRTQTPELAQARLGLIRATQTTLQFLLKDFLATDAPVEL